jgi:hypothetical protein
MFSGTVNIHFASGRFSCSNCGFGLTSIRRLRNRELFPPYWRDSRCAVDQIGSGL